MNFESKNFRQFNLPFNLESLDLVDIVDSSIDVKENDIVFISTKNEEDCQKFVAEAIEKKAGYIFTYLNLKLSHENVYSAQDFDGLLSSLSTFKYPQYKEKNTFGVTGTNGKTTTCHFLNILLGESKSEFVGTTTGKAMESVTKMPSLTTPTFVPLIKYISRNEEIQNIILEVSSHAIEQNRLSNLKFDKTSFTNLSQDHLDFHTSIDDYFQTKKKLFKPERSKFGIIFSNDWGIKLTKDLSIDYVTVGFESSDFATFKTRRQDKSATEGTLLIDNAKYDLRLPISGPGSVDNFLIAITNAYFSDGSFENYLVNINELRLPDGRYQKLVYKKKNVIIDYAHTPEALSELLTFAKGHYKKVLVLFGCGGNRDVSKREKMGKASEIADSIILTSDNPRDENPEGIIEAILNGISQKEKVTIIVNRKEAIEHAISNIDTEEEVIILTGRGHEAYQEVDGKFLPFNDYVVAEEILKGEK